MFEVTQNRKTKKNFMLYYDKLLEKYYNFKKKDLIKHLKKISEY